MRKFPLSRFIALPIVLALALTGCVPESDQQPTVGKPSFTRDLAGFAPDSTDWIFISVELNYLQGDRGNHSLSPTQLRLAPTDDSKGGWLPDVSAMELLSQNESYFAEFQDTAGTVTLVYQAPAERLVGAVLANSQFDAESGKPVREFDLGITEVPTVTGEAGGAPIGRVPLGEAAVSGDFSFQVEQVRMATLIAGMAPQFGSRFAVVELKATCEQDAGCSLSKVLNAVRLVATPGQPASPNLLANRMLADDNPFLTTDPLAAKESKTGTFVFEMQEETDPYLSIGVETGESLRRFELDWAAAKTEQQLNPDPKSTAIGTEVLADPLKVTVLKKAETKDGAVRVQVKVTNTAKTPVQPGGYFRLLDGDHKVINAKAEGSLDAPLEANKSATGWLSFPGGKAQGGKLLFWNDRLSGLGQRGASLARFVI
ncbi:MAG: hypothetical protein LBK28_04980 [Propionibacteriaceae bacterium]|jgi:hypothetical protein|nr:hypothetical protein [Propionibacteriaceae bacterium]